ncbi:MAG: hypothetical protein ACE5RN_06055 [Nitrosopumilaceae archaeon]
MKVVAVSLAILLLLPLGAFPPMLPQIFERSEVTQALHYADSIGLTKELPELKSILLEQAYAQENPGKKLGQGQLIIDGSSTPLQRGLEQAVKNRQNEGKGNPNCLMELEKENPDPDKVSKFCNSPKLQMLIDENCPECGDIIENGKKVGFRIKTQTIIEFDDPGKGAKKKNGDPKEKWDDLMIGKPDVKGIGKSKNSNPQSSKLNGASAFPSFADNNDNDCIDLSTGEIFFGDPDDNISDDCFDSNGKIKNGFREQVDEDPEDLINNDNDCRNDSTGAIHGGLATFGLPNDDDVCLNPNGSLKIGFTELVNEDPAGNGNEDNDCQEITTGRIMGGNVNNGDPRSCFESDGTLKDGFEELVDEDDVDSIDNDSDGQFDEDGPEPFEDSCAAAGGEMVGDECDITKMAIKKANEESQKMTGKDFNFDNDCKETATGKIFGGAVDDGTAHSCFESDGALKDGFEELVDEDGPDPPIDNDSDGREGEDPPGNGNEDKDCEDSSGNHHGGFIGNSDNLIPDGNAQSCFESNGTLKDGMTELIDEDGTELSFNNDNDCMDSEGKIFGGAIDDGTDHSCFDDQGDLKNGFNELIDEDDDVGLKAFKADDDGTPNPNAKGEAEYGTERRVVTINEDFEIRIPEQAAVGNNPNVSPSSFTEGNELFGQIQSFFTSVFGIEDAIPKAYGETTLNKNMIMGFTFAPPNIKWGIDYKKESCFGPLKIFGVTIIPRFCITLLAVFIGYDFGVAVGLRLPVGVEVSAIPERTRPQKIINLASSVTPKDFSAQEYETLCNNNDLKNQAWLITNCDKFSFPNFYDEINPLVPDSQKDGDEFVARYKVKAGIFVTVLGIPLIQWGVNQESDLGALCTYALAQQKVDKIALLQALLAGPQTNPPSISKFLQDLGVNCSSFVTPFGDDEDGNARSFPIAVQDLTIRASCIDAIALGEVIVVQGTVIPICTGLYLFYAGASLGAGLGLSTSLGSNTIKADWSASEDVAPGTDGIVTYNGAGKASPISGTFSGDDLIGDNYDNNPNNHDLNVVIDDYTYFLNRAEVTGTAILDFGGLLGFIPDIPAFTLFKYNFFDAIPGDGIPIPQHPFTSGIDTISIFVENNALATEISTEEFSKNTNKLEIQPKPPKKVTYYVKGINLGNINDGYELFEYSSKLTNPLEPILDERELNAEISPSTGDIFALKSPDDVAAPGATHLLTPLDITPLRDFTTAAGTYEIKITGESIGANKDNLNSPDPSNLVRRDAVNTIEIEIKPFGLPLLRFDQEDLTPEVRIPGVTVGFETQVTNGGNAADTIAIEKALLDSNSGACSLTDRGNGNLLCPYRAQITVIQDEWTTFEENIPLSTGELSSKNTVPDTSVSTEWLSNVMIPSDWAAMEDTTYQLFIKITSMHKDDPNPPGTPVTNEITQNLVITATKESMMRYIGLELDELKQKLTNTSLEDGAITGLLAILEHPVTDTYNNAFEDVLSDKFNPANKKLSTLQKQVEAFLLALGGIDGSDKLDVEGDDWKASGEAIMEDIQTTIDFNDF